MSAEKDEPDIIKTLRKEEHYASQSRSSKQPIPQNTINNQRDSELRIKDSAIESSINAIAITDLDGNISYVNQSFLEMWKYYNKQEILGQPAVKFWQMKGQYVEIMDTLMEKGGWVGELVAERRDGSVFDVQLSSTMVKDEGGKPLCMMASFVDITKRKQAEHELQISKQRIEQQNIQLKKLDRLKSAFLNTTSHELRTPMSSIKGYVQMLLKESLGDITVEQQSALEVVLRNTNRLDRLIQDILDISRLESGTMKFIPEKTNTAVLVDEVIETMNAEASVKHISFTTDIETNIFYLVIDRDRIKQTMVNILHNAVKFSPEKSTIQLKVFKKDNNIVFSIQDFGRGIPKQQQQKIFETFYQVDSGVDRKFGGAGLGLAIARGIVLAHGGNIWVESTEGKGSTFFFSLPLTPVLDAEQRFKEIDLFHVNKS